MSGKRLHPLHSVEFLASMIAHTGCYPDPERCTGRTTILALQFIVWALQNPHKWGYPSDHHGTAAATVALNRTIREMVEKLGLKHFNFRATSLCFGNPNG